jgi:lipid-binding SYLF domain-containing protein
MRTMRFVARVLALALAIATSQSAGPAMAASAGEIDRNVDMALTRLYSTTPEARHLGTQAKGILVFPSIVKAGFLFGAQYGEGALRQRGRTTGYYNSAAASYGLQACIQEFGYVLFLMNDSAIRYLDTSGGWEIGSGPSIVILDVGKAKALTSTTLQNDIYAVIFDQKGLMAGLGLQGSKISRIER